MNNQQYFSNSGTSYGDPRPFNSDPREQPGFMPPGLNTDPREQPQWQPMPQPPMMTRPPQQGYHPWRWLGISVVILVVIFGGLFSASTLLTHQISATKTFSVGSAPKLVLTADSGDVHIFSGASNQISIVAREHVFVGDNSSVPVHYDLSSDGNTLTVSADEGSTFSIFGFNNSGVDFDVTVPSQTTLDIHADSGSITSSGVTGPMTLTASSGDVTTDGGSGQVNLTSDSGDIRASNISGQMTLSASSGNITVSEASASGNSTFHSDSGDINYSGSLDPHGTYGFHASSGSVTLALPSDSAFQVQASTSSGDIDSDFSGVNVQHGDSGAQASGRVGTGSAFAQITIQADSGDIHLREE
ncbi:MAG TPA: DUF4097 family beta strand repeat-containing protein [Ktedonobacterales bacterium]|nr:DUF4097 family beta strand repeat-containing protein [Ktedonobacterales bacterium]